MQKKEELNRLGIHSSWHDVLFPLFHTADMYNIINKYFASECYPEKHLIFKVFSMPVEKIRCVLLGQDPYYDGSAIGLAFAVKRGNKVPLSLKVIFKSIQEQYHSQQEIDQELTHWVEQGVFLLNTALTVEKGKPGSHLELWENFTNTVIKHIAVQADPVWLLFGKKAEKYKDAILEIDLESLIIIRSHPAATRYGVPFEHFCNQVAGKKFIKWM